MADVENIVIKRLYVLFGPPSHIAESQLGAFLQEYHESLSGYSDDVLKKAMDWVRDNQADRWWPTPGVIRKGAAQFAPAAKVSSKGWDEADGWEPNSEISRANVKRMHEGFKRAMAAQSLGEIVKKSPSLDVSRTAMEENNRRWRKAERVQSAAEIAKRITGERD